MDDARHDAKAVAREEFELKLKELFADKAEEISRLLMECQPGEFFGSTQFKLRDLLMKLGQEANDQALEDRKKTAENQNL